MSKTKIILVGGFLGAGKTTMLWKAAKHLADQGKRVGLITNDQASELVDTKFLTNTGGVTAEVSGSCFCCNFPGFTEAIQSIADQGIDTIIAEPVGSCTDLSATIMQPLKDIWKDRLSVAPLSVMADANRLKEILDGGDSGLHKSAAYIVRKQLEEADVILINKVDLLTPQEAKELKSRTEEAFSGASVFTVSAQEDVNIENWLNQVEKEEVSGTHLLKDIDYDTYAEGEAVLGWLNATVALSGSDKDWAAVMTNLLEHLSTTFDEGHHAVGHVKALITEKTNFVVGNVVGTKDTLKVRGTSNGDDSVTLTLNARVEMSPKELEEIVKGELASMTKEGIEADVQVLKCLQPGRPNPTHRYDKVI
jgi:G3E family GTPase